MPTVLCSRWLRARLERSRSRCLTRLIIPLAPGTDAELTNLSLAGVFTATDFDADPVVIDAGASIKIENDVPENNGTVWRRSWWLRTA